MDSLPGAADPLGPGSAAARDGRANVAADRLDAVCKVLPAMREPTISPLHGGAGYAVKVAVKKSELPDLIPEIKLHGGSDIVVTALSQIVPSSRWPRRPS